MANPYTQPSISGYNSNPPADDGSEVASNEVLWATHINKVGDPLKNYADQINANVSTAFGRIFFNAITSLSSNTTVSTSDRGKLFTCTSTFTLTLLAAGDAGSGFAIGVQNNGNGTITIDGDSSETINGSTTIALLPGEGVVMACDGSNWQGIVTSQDIGQKAISGLVPSINGTDAAHDIDISAGQCRDSTGVYNMALTSTLTKQIDAAWAAGDDMGGTVTGTTPAADTWYYIYLIRKDSDGSIDAMFDTSSSAANIPTGYTAYRKIGFVLTDGSNDITAFDAYETEGGGLDVNWNVPVQDAATTNPGTSAVAATVSCPAGVRGKFSFHLKDTTPTSPTYFLATATDQADTTPSINNFQMKVDGDAENANVHKHIRVDSSNQIRYKVSQSNGDIDVYIHTDGWIDPRR